MRYILRSCAILSLLIFTFPDTRFSGAEDSGKSLKGRLDRLEAGVQAEEAIRAVKRLQHSYSHYLEFGL